MKNIFKPFIVTLFVLPFFAIGMDSNYPQLQIGYKKNEAIYKGSLQIAGMPTYCSNELAHQNPNSEIHKFRLAEKNPLITCHLIPIDTSKHLGFEVMVPAQNLLNCNNGSALDVSFKLMEDNVLKTVIFQAQCKPNSKKDAQDFMAQFTDSMDYFYLNGCGTTKTRFPQAIDSLVAKGIIKKQSLPQNSRFTLDNGDDDTILTVSAPVYSHGINGCGSAEAFKQTMMEPTTKQAHTSNVVHYLIGREIGALKK